MHEMDSTDDNSFVTFEHFPDLDICTAENIDRIRMELERKKAYLKQNIMSCLNNLVECLNLSEKDIQEINVLTQTKASTLKDDLDSRLQMINELKIKSEMLESQLNDMHSNVTQEEIENLTREVLTLENEKKQRIEKLVRHRDTIIKCMGYYKNHLDCHLTFTKPDTYTFYFQKKSEDGQLSEKWIKVKTDDYKYWKFIDGTISEEEKAEVISILKETGSIQVILSEVRKMLN